MDFLQKMKKREIVEMSLKTVMAFLACIILIFLMEGMIYGIYMKDIESEKSKNSSWIVQDTVAYCEKIGDDEYKLYLCIDEKTNSWRLFDTASKAEIEAEDYKSVVWHKPTPFDVSITGVHYIVMGAFIVVVLGIYGYRFYRLNKEYIAFAKKLKKTGSIF